MEPHACNRTSCAHERNKTLPGRPCHTIPNLLFHKGPVLALLGTRCALVLLDLAKVRFPRRVGFSPLFTERQNAPQPGIAPNVLTIISETSLEMTSSSEVEQPNLDTPRARLPTIAVACTCVGNAATHTSTESFLVFFFFAAADASPLDVAPRLACAFARRPRAPPKMSMTARWNRERGRRKNRLEIRKSALPQQIWFVLLCHRD